MNPRHCVEIAQYTAHVHCAEFYNPLLDLTTTTHISLLQFLPPTAARWTVQCWWPVTTYPSRYPRADTAAMSSSEPEHGPRGVSSVPSVGGVLLPSPVRPQLASAVLHPGPRHDWGQLHHGGGHWPQWHHQWCRPRWYYFQTSSQHILHWSKKICEFTQIHTWYVYVLPNIFSGISFHPDYFDGRSSAVYSNLFWFLPCCKVNNEK